MRVAVLSDIHSNLIALDAVLDALGTLDAVWLLGDVVGYGPEPDGVVDRLREIGATGVRGNHDAAAVGGPELEWFNLDARRAIEWTRTVIVPRTREWLAALPERAADGPFRLVHGSLLDPTWEYVTSSRSAAENLAALDALGGRWGLHGHTHVPVVFRSTDGSVAALVPESGASVRLDERPTLLNPGSVGQPRDGDPRASWLVLDTDHATVTWRRIAYDVAAVQRAMRARRLPPRLADRLASGS